MKNFRSKIEKMIGTAWIPYSSLRGGISTYSVLVYHHIPQQDLEKFEEQIALFHREYGFVQPDMFQKAVIQGNLDSLKGVVLTFDDGFASSFHAAREILKRYSVKAFFFLPTGFLNARSGAEQKEYIAQRMFRGRLKVGEVPDEMRAMTWEEAGILAEEGHCIGGHTQSHPVLSAMPDPAGLEEEIIGSGDEIGRRLGIPVDGFAFPFGNIESIDARAFGLIRKRYQYCFSSVRGRNRNGTGPHAILRETVSLESPLSFVRCVAENGLGFLYRGKARRLQVLAR